MIDCPSFTTKHSNVIVGFYYICRKSLGINSYHISKIALVFWGYAES